MAEYQNKATQQEKLEALRNDTLFSRQQNTVDDAGGRYAKINSPTLTGTASAQVPKLPENSPWASPDPSGTEAPLGYSVDEN